MVGVMGFRRRVCVGVVVVRWTDWSSREIEV